MNHTSSFAARLLVLALVAATSIASAINLTRGPYIQDLTPHTAVIMWETDQPANSDVSAGLTQSYTLRATDQKPVTQHEVTLSGLQMGKLYHYTVRSGGETLTPDLQFHSGKDGSFNQWHFVAMGDHRPNPQRLDHHTTVALLVQRLDPEIILDTGDLTLTGHTVDDWNPQFFMPEKHVLSRACIFPVLGNHESNGARYLDYFHLPTQNSGNERYYSFDYANAHITALDTTTSFTTGTAQYVWLAQDLAKNQDKNWRFVVMHNPPYSTGSGHGSDLLVRETLVPLFEKYKVDVVFTGHDHDYERGVVNGITYIVTGGGGAPLYQVKGDWWTKAKASALHVCDITVNGNQLELKAIKPDGTIIDDVTITATKP